MSALPSLPDAVAGRRLVVEETLHGSMEPGQELRDVDFDGCTFSGCALEQARLLRCTFIDTRFVACDLSLAVLTDSRLVGVVFERCKLLGLNFAALGARGPAADPLRFHECRLDMACFAGVDATGAGFAGCRLTEADFTDATLRGADFAGSDLHGARFANTDLREASLLGATGYTFDVRENRVRGLRLDAAQAVPLLGVFGIEAI